MARQGRFGRPTSGTQNLSSLIYMLLKEERNAQEDTMLRSYKNNMEGGTTRNTFTSGNQSSAATAGSVYQWYLKQAELAQSQGDNVGYNALVQKAEDFRLQSLRDQESVLNSAYANGTSIDKALFGVQGGGTISLQDYEALLTNIAKQPGMTEADVSRIQRTIFGASYESASSDIVRQYNEKKIKASSLVNFYDKELVRAKASGLTVDSKQYQAILDARSRAVAAKKADAAQARYDEVANKMKDENKAFAIALQKFITPILGTVTSSKSAKDALLNKITDDGTAFLNSFTAWSNGSGIGLKNILDKAGLANGGTIADVDNLVKAFQDYTSQISDLEARGLGKEAKGFRDFATAVGSSVTSGAFAAVARGSSDDLRDGLRKTGGELNSPMSADPFSVKRVLGDFNTRMKTVAESSSYDEITTADTVAQIADGNLIGVIPAAPPELIADGVLSIDELSDYISKSTGLENSKVLTNLAYLFGASDGWTQGVDPDMASVRANLVDMGITTRDDFAKTVSGRTDLGTLAGLAFESKIADVVQNDPNLVWAYRKIRGRAGYTYVPISVQDAKTGDYTLGASSTNNNEMVYIERVKLSTLAADDSSAPTDMYYVARPGGGNSLNTGQMDDNDYVEFSNGGLTYKLNKADLEEFATRYGTGIGGYNTPQVNPNDTSTVLIGAGLVADLIGNKSSTSPFKLWIESKSASDPEWYKQRVVVGKEKIPVQLGNADDTIAGYVKDITGSIPTNIPFDQRERVVDQAVKDYFANNGITDKTSKLSEAIKSRIKLMEPDVTSGYVPSYGGGSIYQSAGADSPPQAPYVSSYLPDLTNGGYGALVPITQPGQAPAGSVTAPQPIGQAGSYFFRKNPLIVNNPEVSTSPVINVAPAPNIAPAPTPVINSGPKAGLPFGGGI